MKILFAASEGVPYSKTGGLADVVGALAPALAKKGHEIRTVLPLYRETAERHRSLATLAGDLWVALGPETERVQVRGAGVGSRHEVWLLDNPAMFDRPGLYGPHPGAAYADNDRRFALYCRAVLESAKRMGFQPDIIHCHDWQSGLIPAQLKFTYRHDSFFRGTAAVFTIHNIAYQGNFPPSSLQWSGLPPDVFHVDGLEFYGQVSFLKAALQFAEELNTVSPTYAREVCSDPRYGSGMEGLLRKRAGRFRGITNGLDTDSWNPAGDEVIAERYDEKKLALRDRCKVNLQKTAHLPIDPGAPLLAFIGRLDPQKGVDVMIEAAEIALKQHRAQLVTLGQGHPDFARRLADLQQRYPSQVFVESAFAEALAHKIYAGADLFLMPSRFEPCGLGQMIAMRYGAVPVVTPTGGLLDTVEDVSEGGGTGFIAEEVSTGSFLNALLRALSAWRQKKNWPAIQRRGMKTDHSWAASVPRYEEMYVSARKRRRGER